MAYTPPGKHTLFPSSSVAKNFKLAMGYQREDVFIMLLESGADVSCPDSYGEQVSTLSRIGLNLTKNSPLVEALWLSSQSWPIVARHPLYEDASDYLSRPLRHQVLCDGTLDELTAYLQREPEAVLARDSFGLHFTLLHWAAITGASLPKIRAIITAGADVNAPCNHGMSAVMWPVYANGSVGICELLLSSGADVNDVDANRESVLFRAITGKPWHDQEVIVESLLRAGANIHQVNVSGETALHRAVQTASVNLCQLLLDYGSAIDARDHLGYYHITLALWLNHRQAMELFVKRGARLDIVFNAEDNSSTILLWAGMFGDIRTMRILTRAHISGVRMDRRAVHNYWLHFQSCDDDERFLGTRAPFQVEQRAFHELLDSIIPLNLHDIPVTRTYQPRIPGAFSTGDGGSPHHILLPPVIDPNAALNHAQFENSGEENGRSKSTHVDSNQGPVQSKVALEEGNDNKWNNPLYPRQVTRCGQSSPANRTAAMACSNSQRRLRFPKHDHVRVNYTTRIRAFVTAYTAVFLLDALYSKTDASTLSRPRRSSSTPTLKHVRF